MKQTHFYLPFLFLIIVVVGCSNTTLKPDSPHNTAWMLKLAFNEGDYEAVNELFAEGRKNTLSESDFAEISKMNTARAEYTNYVTVAFEDGGMLLVRLAPADEDGKVAVEDVIVVPEEMKVFLKK